jgi:hypothetical protein
MIYPKHMYSIKYLQVGRLAASSFHWIPTGSLSVLPFVHLSVCLFVCFCPSISIYLPSLGKKGVQFENDMFVRINAPCERNLKKLARYGKSWIRWKECDQPQPFLIVHLEVTVV